MTATVTGTTWQIDRVVSVTDGDTLRAVRTRIVDVLDGIRLTATDDNPKGQPIRLPWVDTPERGEPGWNEARLDLMAWVTLHPTGLTVVCYGSAGWDRILGDVRAGDESAAQWLMAERGWAPFLGTPRVTLGP